MASCLDYSDLVLYGINLSTIGRLQLMMNTAARFLTSTRMRQHITRTWQIFIGFLYSFELNLRFCYLFISHSMGWRLHIYQICFLRAYPLCLLGQLTINYFSRQVLCRNNMFHMWFYIVSHMGFTCECPWVCNGRFWVSFDLYSIIN